jgi:2'-5' RNA ligase
VGAKAKRVVVVFPRVESVVEWGELVSMRDRFDPLAQAIGAHLTLVSPFEDALPDAALEQHVRSVAGLPAFPVILSEVTAHEDEYLFLNVKQGNDELILLRDNLYRGPLAPHRDRSHTFVPHVTVGRVSRERLPLALDETALLTAAIRARVDTISCYRIEPDGRRPLVFEVVLPPR